MEQSLSQSLEGSHSLSSPHLLVTAAPSPAPCTPPSPVGGSYSRAFLMTSSSVSSSDSTHTSSCHSAQVPELRHGLEALCPHPTSMEGPARLFLPQGLLHWLWPPQRTLPQTFPQLGPSPFSGVSSNAPHGKSPPAAIQLMSPFTACPPCLTHCPFPGVLPIAPTRLRLTQAC